MCAHIHTHTADLQIHMVNSESVERDEILKYTSIDCFCDLGNVMSFTHSNPSFTTVIYNVYYMAFMCISQIN